MWNRLFTAPSTFGYSSWVVWKDAVKSAIAEKNAVVTETEADIEVGRKGLAEAEERGLQPNQKIDVEFPKNNTSSDIEVDVLKRLVPDWKVQLSRARTEMRRVWVDAVARTTWDFVLPTATLIGPIWYFLFRQ